MKVLWSYDCGCADGEKSNLDFCGGGIGRFDIKIKGKEGIIDDS